MNRFRDFKFADTTLGSLDMLENIKGYWRDMLDIE